jgi:hypothetical protein
MCGRFRVGRRIFTLQQWSERPCVRPVCAVLNAGHNALRESGPGQNLAFDDAMAQVGCPDRAPVPAVGFPASDRLQSRRRILLALCDRPALRGWRRRPQQPAGLSSRHHYFLPRLSKAALFILGGGASSCLPPVLPPRSQRHHCRIELANTAEQLNFQAIPNHRPFPKARSASWTQSRPCVP